jgi:hypothetical protein
VCVSESGSACDRGSALRFKFRVSPLMCVCVRVGVCA